MRKTANIINLTLVLASVLFADSALAYGNEKSDDACAKPKFSNFKPPHKSEVAPGSEFSFTVSRRAGSNTIEVNIKKIPVEVTVEQRDTFYLVKGRLPETLTGTFARISAKAKTIPGDCKGTGGWLVKITE